MSHWSGRRASFSYLEGRNILRILYLHSRIHQVDKIWKMIVHTLHQYWPLMSDNANLNLQFSHMPLLLNSVPMLFPRRQLYYLYLYQSSGFCLEQRTPLKHQQTWILWTCKRHCPHLCTWHSHWYRYNFYRYGHKAVHILCIGRLWFNYGMGCKTSILN